VCFSLQYCSQFVLHVVLTILFRAPRCGGPSGGDHHHFHLAAGPIDSSLRIYPLRYHFDISGNSHFPALFLLSSLHTHKDEADQRSPSLHPFAHSHRPEYSARGGPSKQTRTSSR